VEFRLGEIEDLPVADATVDVIISSVVVNLSPDKGQVCRDPWRVLKRDGRLALSEVVTTAPLPEAMQQEAALYTACVDELTAMLAEAGFVEIQSPPRMPAASSFATGRPAAGSRISSRPPPSRPSSRQAEGERRMKETEVLGSGRTSCETILKLIEDVAQARGAAVIWRRWTTWRLSQPMVSCRPQGW
jgi:SAM-dependent methyltransferase